MHCTTPPNFTMPAALHTLLFTRRASIPALHDIGDHRPVMTQVVEDMQVRCGSAFSGALAHTGLPAQKPVAARPTPRSTAASSDPLLATARATAYTGVLMLLQAAIRHRTKLSVVQADLARMNAPEAFVSDFVAVLRRL